VALELTGISEVKAPSVDVAKLKHGLSFNYYEGNWQRLPDFSEMKPLRSGTVGNLVYPESTADLNFGLAFSGYMKIEADGMYDFFLTSDDGSRLTIDNDEVVLNDGLHAMVEVSGSVFLKKGYHTIGVSFFQAGGGSGLKLMLQAPGKERTPVGDELLYYEEKK
jgi:hypothetical protein